MFAQRGFGFFILYYVEMNICGMHGRPYVSGLWPCGLFGKSLLTYTDEIVVLINLFFHA